MTVTTRYAMPSRAIGDTRIFFTVRAVKKKNGICRLRAETFRSRRRLAARYCDLQGKVHAM